MKITFKNVGQGDSIILEWEVNNIKKIAIVDCNLDEDKNNPILNYIIEKDYRCLNYLFLSHPHTDHYSGFRGLLEYCLQNKIIIEKFIHSSVTVPGFLRMANKSVQANDEFQNIVRLIQRCKKDFSTDYGTMSVGISDEIDLGDGYLLKWLSLGSSESDKYTGKIDYGDDTNYEEVEGNSAYAN